MHLNPSSSSFVYVLEYHPLASLVLAWDGPKAGVLQHLIPVSFPYALTVGAKARVSFSSISHGWIELV